MGKVADRFGKSEVSSGVETDHPGQRPLNEEGFQNHLIPGRLGKMLGRERIIEGDGIVDLDDIGAKTVDRGADEFRRFGQKGEGGVDGSLLTDVGGIEELGERVQVDTAILFRQGEEKDHPGEAEFIPVGETEPGGKSIHLSELVGGRADALLFVEMPGDTAEIVVESSLLERHGVPIHRTAKPRSRLGRSCVGEDEEK